MSRTIFKVYVKQFDESGALKHAEFVRGHYVESEARQTASNMRRSIKECGNDRTHLVEIEEEST